MRAAQLGKKYALGCKHTAETCAKISIALKGRPRSIEERIKISLARKGKCTGDKNSAWMGGISRAPYAWTFDVELRAEVRRRDGHRCQSCGVPQAECRQLLDVHHVDYDKKNSDPVNLITVCRRCHGKMAVNRKHWTEVFQAMAIKRSIAELER